MKNIENNRLIAEFMAFQTRTDAIDDRVLAYYVGNVIKNADNSKNKNEENVFHPEDMRFDTDWNWLMEVVEKIESLSFDVVINYNICTITNGENEFRHEVGQKIYATYQAVIEFINWYNEKK